MKIALLAAVAATVFAAPALAQATVETNPAAPSSNFAAPTNQAIAGYTIDLSTSNDTLHGVFTQTGGTRDGLFSNLYFDLDPNSGSDFGIEVTNSRYFIPGLPGYGNIDASLLSFNTVIGTDGLATLTFDISNSLFRDAISQIRPNNTTGDVRLNLSQTFSYSVAGGQAFYGDSRLGTFNVSAVTAAVPEPGTWALMLLGFGGVGVAMRRSRRQALTPQIA